MGRHGSGFINRRFIRLSFFKRRLFFSIKRQIRLQRAAGGLH
jgi:hypothetical protein